MPLGSLLKLVETLRERIDEHGDALRQSEALTRYALIDPMLRELGWDTDDPVQVVPEYRVANNQMADYVLRANDAPAIVVESKKLDEPLQGGKALDQGILYSAHTRSGYFLLTDGRRWELYEGRSTDLVESFDLLDQSPAEVCLRALALWRPSVESGHVGAGSTSATHQPSETGAVPTLAPTPWKADVNNKEWRSLSDWHPVQGEAQPDEIMFPDDSRVKMKYAYSVAVESVRWLTRENVLTASHCPITKDNRGTRNLVTDDPDLLPDQNDSDKKKVGALYVGTQYNGHIHVRNARTIIERVCQDPSQFKVHFSPPPS